MELWIRSQNKQELAKAEHVGVYDNRVYINGYDENEYCIGEYKTEKRALEVLDEIEERITINYGYELATNSGIRPNYITPANYTAVYEMPKE